MEIEIRDQILEAAATLLCGLGLGLFYEILGELRAHCGRLCGAVLDVLFCAVFAAALFLLGMGPGNGCLRLYMPVLAMGGMALWSWLFGAATRRFSRALLSFAWRGVCIFLRPIAKCLNFLKKFEKIVKNVFSKAKKRFTIIHNLATEFLRAGKKHLSEDGDISDEAQAFQYIYEDRDPGHDRVRIDQPRECP